MLCHHSPICYLNDLGIREHQFKHQPRIHYPRNILGIEPVRDLHGYMDVLIRVFPMMRAGYQVRFHQSPILHPSNDAIQSRVINAILELA